MNNFTPEQLQSLLQQGSYDDQNRAIEEQLAHAYALRNGPDRRRIGLGGPIGAAGDIMSTIASYKQEGKLRDQQKTMQQAYIDSLTKAFAPQQQSQGPMPQPGAEQSGMQGAETPTSMQPPAGLPGYADEDFTRLQSAQIPALKRKQPPMPMQDDPMLGQLQAAHQSEFGF